MFCDWNFFFFFFVCVALWLVSLPICIHFLIVRWCSHIWIKSCPPLRRSPVVAAAVLANLQVEVWVPSWGAYPFPWIREVLVGELCHMLTVTEPLRQPVKEISHLLLPICTLIGRGLWCLLINEMVYWGFISSLWYSDVYQILSVLEPSARDCENCTTSSLPLSSLYF